MGNGLASFTSSGQQDSLQYYSSVKDQNLGYCQVYSVRHLPMCYVLKVKRRSCSSSQIFRSIENKQNKSLISLYGFIKVNYCDCQDLIVEGIVFYWQYFNFYLNNLLERRTFASSYFQESEVWHLISACAEGYQAFRQQKVLYVFSPATLVLTPQGKLKLFWANIEEHNNHLPFFDHFESGRLQPESSFYSPEQLESMRIRHMNFNIDFERSNMFSFGMLLLYVTTLCNPLVYYRNHYHLDFQGIQASIVRMSSMYSKQICRIVGSCLDRSPFGRYSFQNILQLYSRWMGEEYSIRFQTMDRQGESNEKYDSTKRISLKKKLL